MEMNDKLLTIKEAAEFLSVNPRIVRQYARKGILKAYKLGNNTGKGGSKREWRIWHKDLVDFINKGTKGKEQGLPA